MLKSTSYVLAQKSQNPKNQDYRYLTPLQTLPRQLQQAANRLTNKPKITIPQGPGSASRLEAQVLALTWLAGLIDVLFMVEMITLMDSILNLPHELPQVVERI